MTRRPTGTKSGRSTTFRVRGARRLCCSRTASRSRCSAPPTIEVFALDRPLPAQERSAVAKASCTATRVTCPLHNWVIDLDDGEAVAPDEGARRSRCRCAMAGRLTSISAGRAKLERRVSTSAPPVPIAVSAAALLVDPDGSARGRSRSSGQFRPAVLQGRGAGRHAGHDGPAAVPTIDGRDASWDEALDLIAARISRTHRASMGRTPSPSMSPASS